MKLKICCEYNIFIFILVYVSQFSTTICQQIVSITYFFFSPPLILFYFYNWSFFIFILILSPPHVYPHVVLSYFKFQKASLISLRLVSHHVGTHKIFEKW